MIIGMTPTASTTRTIIIIVIIIVMSICRPIIKTSIRIIIMLLL